MGGLTPPEPRVACEFGELRANQACAAFTGCGNSFCQEDNTCFPCDPTDDAPLFPLGGPVSALSTGALREESDRLCRVFSSCETAKAQILDEDISLTAEGVYEANVTCDVPCSAEELTGTPLTPLRECLLA